VADATVSASPAAVRAAVGGTGDTAAALRARSGPVPGRQPPGRVRIRALGPLTVLHGSTEVRLTGKRRVLAGRLALSPGVPVPVAELMDLLWPRRAPREPAGALHAHVSRLRRTVEPAPSAGGTLHPISDGYRLTMSDDELDVRQFRRAAADAHVLVAACPEVAVGMLEAALHLWRGSPCADVEQLVHHPSVAMLREERVAAVLLLADLAAALRQHGRSLPHLRALATEQPLHEPLYARLIAALAATGLQAQAVAAYQGIRRRLAGDLGIDPGPELTETYCRVLRQQIGPAARGS
jgi:DNA-binding SARP family transcriptional activator